MFLGSIFMDLICASESQLTKAGVCKNQRSVLIWPIAKEENFMQKEGGRRNGAEGFGGSRRWCNLTRILHNAASPLYLLYLIFVVFCLLNFSPCESA